jgi:hypothetical protein|tara:strand:- start:56 stop:412 length:357 start_codon:yes stop_codon:yes gene_type:complete
MGNFVSLLIDVVKKSPTPTPFSTPFPTSDVSSEIENVISILPEYETSQLLNQSQHIDTSVPFPTSTVSSEFDNIYENVIETFVGDHSYLKNTRTNKMSQGILKRNIDSNILGPNTISK